jgi:hypothetical protein
MLGTDRRDGESPFGFGSDATVGLAIVAEIAAELISGTLTLLDQDGLYGAAALLRQLVEVEYLCWAFAEDEDEAKRWMRLGAAVCAGPGAASSHALALNARGRGRGVDHDLPCLGGSKAGANLLIEIDGQHPHSPHAQRLSKPTFRVDTRSRVAVAERDD